MIFSSSPQRSHGKILSRDDVTEGDVCRIASFHQIISRGFPSYNCQFNLAKTSSNLQSEDQTSQAVFCGALLDFKSREIFPKYSSYASSNLYFHQRWPSWAEADKPLAFISK